MPHVQVTIAGRAYRMACGEGEEAHLTALAGRFDARIAEMRETFGAIGDMRLHVMAALTLADDAAEAERQLARLREDAVRLQADAEAMREGAEADRERAAAGTARIAAALDEAAGRLDRLAAIVSGRPSEP